MAPEIHPFKAVEGSTKNLKINPPSIRTNSNLSGRKDGNTSDAISCISSGDARSSTKESEVDREALTSEQGMYYPANESYGYYYPGFDGSCGEWDARIYFAQADGSEIQHSASQTDNGSAIYYFPGFQSDYTPYSAFLPGVMNNVDGQYLGQHLYYPSTMFSQPNVPPSPQSVAYGPEFVPAYSWDPSLLYGDGLSWSEYGGNPTFSVPKPNFSSQIHTHTHSKTLHPSKPTTTEKKGSSPTQNQSLKPINKGTSVISYPHQGNSGPVNPPSTTNIKETGRSWVGSEKLKARNRTHASGDFDVLNEQNHGPRTNGARSTWNPEAGSAGPLGAEGNENSGTLLPSVRKEDYNLSDFPTKYDYALFFVIKSYSEDDIHKSIKYNVWASTPNGNKRLDNAFQVAHEKMAEKGGKFPIFLFFSVNASGQFCGVAEMIGGVDFSKNMDFWHQDKWTGFFPVKWHIIKDIPNPQLRHIILENNENKPITNSRDTQEVKFRQGIEMLDIFKNYSSKTSILDDFSFYENRQKAMQDKRISQPAPNLDHLSQPETDDDEAQATELVHLKSIVSSLQSIELESAGVKEGTALV